MVEPESAINILLYNSWYKICINPFLIVIILLSLSLFLNQVIWEDGLNSMCVAIAISKISRKNLFPPPLFLPLLPQECCDGAACVLGWVT